MSRRAVPRRELETDEIETGPKFRPVPPEVIKIETGRICRPQEVDS